MDISREIVWEYIGYTYDSLVLTELHIDLKLLFGVFDTIRELSKRAIGKTLYLINEPTTGFSFYDVHKLLDVLQRLVDKVNSVIAIGQSPHSVNEHNLDVIRCSDWTIDLGPEGGNKGGELVAVGTPEQVAKNPKSHTGKYLKQVLKQHTR